MINMKPLFKVTTQCSQTEEVVYEQTFDNYKEAKEKFLDQKRMKALGYDAFMNKVVPDKK